MLRAVLRRPDFRRLYGTRLTSQCADGVFQASLAGVVLFSPESAGNPADIAGVRSCQQPSVPRIRKVRTGQQRLYRYRVKYDIDS